MSITAATLRAVLPRQVATWMRSRGWEYLSTESERSAQWKKRVEEGEYVLEQPINPNLRDYPQRLMEVLETLSVAEAMSIPLILLEVRDSTFDIVRLRTTGPGIGEGRLPLELGPRLFQCTRDLLLAASCSAHDPRSVYRSRKPTATTEFMGKLKISPPEAGSFIITVHSPVPPQLQTALAPDLSEVPFERKPTLMLASGISEALRAAERAGIEGDGSSFFEAADKGVSANLCEALAGFVDGDDITGLDVRFGWAASRSVSRETPTQLHLGADLSPYLREAASRLRQLAPTPDFELFGVVTKLQSEQPSEGGSVVVTGSVDSRMRRVIVELDGNAYERAIRAHEEGALVRCEGELRQERGRWELAHCRSISVVADQE